MASHSISVIVPNLNSPLIERTVEALRTQTVDPARVEILVVGLDEKGLVPVDDRVRTISEGRPTSAAYNRNRGMEIATGDIFCFTDADCVPARDWLERLTAPYTDERVDVVGGGVVFGQGNYWSLCDNLSWFYQFLSSSPAGQRAHLPTLNLSIRREVLESVGGMSPLYPLAAGEDTEWTERMRKAGYTLHFLPDAVVTHIDRRTTVSALWRHGYHYGQYSPKIGYPSGHVPSPTPVERLLLRRWWLLVLLSPLLASLATVRTLQSQRAWHTLPGVWVSKLAWCMGAARTLRRREIA
ncbi:MAG: glycosyltransferase [Chloroflexi bacterium]|nr:MAG: glycosyltransferase [Chloroflexota bacterium]